MSNLSVRISCSPLLCLFTVAILTAGCLGSKELSSSKPDLRRRAVLALQQSGSPQTIAQLKEVLLSDLDELVRAQAAVGLGKIGDSTCVPVLISALADESSLVRKDVCEALARLPDTRAVEPLCQVLGNQEEHFLVRVAAAKALAAIGNEKAIPTLIQCLLAQEQSVSFACWRTLCHISGQKLPRNPQKWQEWHENRKP